MHSHADVAAGRGGRHPVVLAVVEAGQHLVAVLLTVVATVRAVSEGAPTVLAVLAGAVYLAWYVVGATVLARTRHRAASRAWLAGLALTWLLALAVSPEYMWLAFLLWLLAGHLLPGWSAVAFSALVYVGVVVAPLAHGLPTSWANVFGPLIGGLFALGMSRGYLQLLREAREREELVSSLKASQAEMAALQDELARAQRESGVVSERTRISRDIHDTIAQGLSSIRLLTRTGAGLDSVGEARALLDQIGDLAQDSLGDVRRIVADLAPAQLGDSALAGALGRLLDALAEQTGMAVSLHVDSSLPSLPVATEAGLLRTAQSALANVRQHASAHRVAVSMSDAGDSVRLDIMDDGAGFDVAAWEAAERPIDRESGYGLRFTRNRLRELGGGLDIESAPGEGTALSAHLPIGGSPS